jgi:hypothetical protein
MELKDWERQKSEPTSAYAAFCLYRDFGPLRNIKKVLKLHGLEVGKAGSWYRWCSKYDWYKRITAYDDWCDIERQKRFEEEEKERADAYKGMLGKVTKIVDEKLDSIKPADISTMQTMDLLERSFELGTKIAQGVTGSDDSKNDGQLEINFVNAFDGI